MLVRRFEDRARILIKRGFNPKDAVEVVLQETELEYRIDPGWWRRRVLMPRISL
jgi:hypothetical protein